MVHFHFILPSFSLKDFSRLYSTERAIIIIIFILTQCVYKNHIYVTENVSFV